jgi:predicted transcriptional regulator
MATITIQTDDALLSRLQRIAEAQHTTVDAVVDEMIRHGVENESRSTAYDELMEKLRPLGPLPRLTREERNAR